MFPTFRATRCREKKEWLQELFSTHPTYQNPIYMNPGPLLCKVFGFGFFVARWNRVNVQTPLVNCSRGQNRRKSTLGTHTATKRWQHSVVFDVGPHGGPGPMGPKGGPMGPKKGPKKGAQRKGTIFIDGPSMNSLMEIFWYSLMEVHWWCPTMDLDGFPVLWNPVLWKHHEKQWTNYEKPWCF